MAKRNVTSKDNRVSLDQNSYRVDDSENKTYRAVYDEDANEKLIEISNKIGETGILKTANENISAIKCVVLNDPNSVNLATNDTTIQDSTVYGISRTAGTAGNSISILISGELYDSSLNFPTNDSIYLGTNGNLTNIAPSSGFLTQVGVSGGPGLIVINIDEPIIL